jgi:N-acetylglucosamine kinase
VEGRVGRVACFDVGGTFLKFGLMSADGSIGDAASVATPDTLDAFIDAVAAMLDKVPDVPVAIAVAGVVVRDTGLVKSANISAIDGVALGGELERKLGRKVIVGNDADCFALAEATFGSGRGKRIVFGIILGTGVGGGLVFNGEIVQGAGGLGGEWGHGPIVRGCVGDPPVDVPRFPCGCGQEGCVDTVGGARGIERLHHAITGETHDSRTIVANWLKGEARARHTMSAYLDLISEPLALIVNTVDADILPVGGGLSSVPQLIALIDEAVRKRILRQAPKGLIVPGALGRNAGMIGAGVLALRQVA